ncbi:dTMP kinase [Clostridium luticellarii]|jgi:dTMP kinase|uniref:Thymidylate kinase n=1 Tax=Clostridium luticellarii TaxID=1691940 RepID=A0A2T0B875_9CLOT|nr:deoxynucleoside kinase [Clostridium luticellarii]MCI1944886.1 deoxynucleoside kinase [Clostridium luticellarii]MCI1968438.1 deoxynucleoside kinase [Clostridium luticellarii]MCI1995436.1 deoxynucleoside kinase [Clostridium luticellarii]MCI2039499.1 deoxynucleoside kinase [Clostridium luticellarii]PRR80055.1 Thymidylate kinase [Clostridium luticellarii]
MKSLRGKLIVIEGCDGSGKATQTKMLYEKLLNEKYNVKKVEYPDYASQSSALIKMYLNGDFGKNPEDVNAYVASTFYGVDRFASYKMNWKEFYEKGGIVLADRYTTANMIHQASKIDDIGEKNKFLEWLWNFEFNIFGLPIPDCVIFLDMPPGCSRQLIMHRDNKFTGTSDKDIHEGDWDYLIKSYKNSLYVAKKYDWSRIPCVEDGRIRNVDEIHKSIYCFIKKIIK